MRFAKTCLRLAGLALPLLASAALAGETQSYKLELNKTDVIRLPGAASAVIVGNPLIADVTVQSVDTLFVVGRGYGETNLLIMDAQGQTMFNANLQVVNSLPSNSVRLYKGTSRETYSCLPYCGPSPVLGDNPGFIGPNTSQQAPLAPFTAFSNPNPSSAAANSGAQSTSDFQTPVTAGGPSTQF